MQEIRVASVPEGHWYVRHLSDPDGHDGVVRLPDPGGSGGVHGWWPPAQLSADWVERNHASFDVLHVHFGFDAVERSDLEDLVAALRRHGKALVYTVHDLRNPHQEDPRAHEERIEALIRRADAVITLTPKAAAEIERRWGRTADVIPHPHIIPAELLPPPQGSRPAAEATAVAGLHLKSLRRNMFGADMIRALGERLGSVRGLLLRVDIHLEALDPRAEDHRPEVAAALRDLADRPAVDLRVHDYFTDEEFYEYVREIDVAVLPYRFGTHSGWLEACRDAGTAVVAPSNGCYVDQGGVFAFDPDLPEPERWDSLTAAIGSAAAARRRGEVNPFGRRERLDQRRSLAREHRRIYEAVVREAAGTAVAVR
jgi:hypothetical protein